MSDQVIEARMVDGSAEPDPDTRFALPGIDDPASTEIGVILLGLEVIQLLAGLGLASLADDPVAVTLLADQVRHGAAQDLAIERVVAIGIQRWLAARALLPGNTDGRTPLALRHEWEWGSRTVLAAGLGPAGPAVLAYLTACWLRRTNIEDFIATQAALPA